MLSKTLNGGGEEPVPQVGDVGSKISHNWQKSAIF